MKINIKSMLEEKNNDISPKNEEKSETKVQTQNNINSEVQENNNQEPKKIPKVGISQLKQKQQNLENDFSNNKEEEKNEGITKEIKDEEKPKITINLDNKNIKKEPAPEKVEKTDEEKFDQIKKQTEINKTKEEDEDIEKFQNEFFSDEKEKQTKNEHGEELFSNYVSGYEQKLEKYEEKEIIKLTKKVKTLMRVIYSFIFIGLIFAIGVTNYLIYDFSKNLKDNLNEELIAKNIEKNEILVQNYQSSQWGVDLEDIEPISNDDENYSGIIDNSDENNSGTGEIIEEPNNTETPQENLTREEINQIVREKLENKIKNIFDR